MIGRYSPYVMNGEICPAPFSKCVQCDLCGMQGDYPETFASSTAAPLSAQHRRQGCI